MNRVNLNGRISSAIICAALGAAGCSSAQPRSLRSHDAAEKIPAMQTAANLHETAAVPDLIKSLGSDDPAVRFYAIESLRRLTGQTLGYVYYAREDDREIAIKRWNDWLANQNFDRSANAIK